MPSLRGLEPRFHRMVASFLRWARPQFPGIVITSARRTYAEQARLYDRFLRGDNDGLPAVKPGTSDHELGLAVDIARLNIRAVEDPVLRALGAAWVSGGGRWSEKDPVHFAAPLAYSRRRQSLYQ